MNAEYTGSQELCILIVYLNKPKKKTINKEINFDFVKYVIYNINFNEETSYNIPQKNIRIRIYRGVFNVWLIPCV